MRSGRVCLLALLLAALFVPPAAWAAGRPAQTTWHSTQIDLAKALKAGWTGRGVTVAVLDGWVDTTHPDFEGRAHPGADCTTGTCTTSMGRDGCGHEHGTHVAGSIASSSYGVAPGVRLLTVRVLKAADGDEGECTGTPNGVAAGIDWAVRNKARVINLSLGPDVPGQTSNGAIASAVTRAAGAGVVVVFSAGNRNLPVAQAYGEDALVVAATGPSGRLASYSQHGEGVSVAAPGGEPTKDAQGNDVCSQSRCITSVYPGRQYAVAAGTSMAAPQVTGLAALLLQQRPSRGREEVEDRIRSTARPLEGAGAGLIDVAAALGVRNASASPAPRRTTPPPTQQPKPAATRTVVRAAVSPTPAAAKATPTPVAVATTAVPAPSPTASTPVLATAAQDEEIPLPVAGLAGALVGLVAAGVLLAGLTRKA